MNWGSIRNTPCLQCDNLSGSKGSWMCNAEDIPISLQNCVVEQKCVDMLPECPYYNKGKGKWTNTIGSDIEITPVMEHYHRNLSVRDREIQNEAVNAMRALRDEGYSRAAIAEAFNRSKSYVSSVLNK